MRNRLIADQVGLFTCELEVSGPVLDRALEHPAADELLHGALIAVLAALAHGDGWPGRARDALTAFMLEMRAEMIESQRC
ncbi:MAG: hypothetical protein SF182_22700 [Deltaproteobacteria bacterium]|nr:hypothetical protein [Deltaproteobacteria bacterium]